MKKLRKAIWKVRLFFMRRKLRVVAPSNDTEVVLDVNKLARALAITSNGVWTKRGLRLDMTRYPRTLSAWRQACAEYKELTGTDVQAALVRHEAAIRRDNPVLNR